MAMASVTVRVDESIKEEAARIAESFGFDLSSVTRAFYRQMVRERAIPLNITTPLPNEESLRAIEEADRIIAEGKPGYKTVEELMEALEA
ncbi:MULTISPECIES: type II toxin-antitoxin system RelB/DinJ family antitoxin [Gordonibacter]|uniref:Type II toxin-antitoxin system RelB/DinJ family antitoxin n=1 Tax=Gordonibacter faecis TaxID=3047475 RepID=A0ABT7DN41_9ACTN|nr:MULTISPECIES: type II toxin-antitoxin system RelB/DinJ family antitoxin [unclassified Gordonibacter]MDJ1650642.1 type II toxin-antitoxin system RelB/DinJ family antitoxin [Gordonibacter sp. KGMB12511]HIW75810.1 type II toxin-antitoxin system RelB/DinJ family antitoxin [Candidatus Gordonibacter avicola]